MVFKVDWVLRDELAISSAPKNLEDLNYLKSIGIKSILTLCSEEEVFLPEIIKSEFYWERYILPDHKYNEAMELGKVKKALEIANYLVQKGPLLIHCYAGVERSPLICMAFLISKRKLSLMQSLQYLMQQHPGTNPLTQQLNILKKL